MVDKKTVINHVDAKKRALTQMDTDETVIPLKVRGITQVVVKETHIIGIVKNQSIEKSLITIEKKNDY